jgi:hypothetical protein
MGSNHTFLHGEHFISKDTQFGIVFGVQNEEGRMSWSLVVSIGTGGSALVGALIITKIISVVYK